MQKSGSIKDRWSSLSATSKKKPHEIRSYVVEGDAYGVKKKIESWVSDLERELYEPVDKKLQHV